MNKIKNFLFCKYCGKTRRVKIYQKKDLIQANMIKSYYCRFCKNFLKETKEAI